MQKSVKKNKRLKWIDSRYAKFYWVNVTWYRMQISQIIVHGAAQRNAILRSGLPGFQFQAVMAHLAIMKALTKIPKPVGRVSHT